MITPKLIRAPFGSSAGSAHLKDLINLVRTLALEAAVPRPIADYV
jgi:hypothetical protein